MERTKTVTTYEFYYPDARPNAPVAFAAQGYIIDHEAGDTITIDGGTLGTDIYVITQANGLVIVIRPVWLWFEKRSVQVKVKRESL